MRALSDGKESGALVGFPRPPVRTYVCVDWQEHLKGWQEVDGSQRPSHLQQKASWNSTGAVAVVSHKHMRWRGSVLGLWMSGLEGRLFLVLREGRSHLSPSQKNAACALFVFVFVLVLFLFFWDGMGDV